jgi:methionine sulfoxide reductase heme-binding subunit
MNNYILLPIVGIAMLLLAALISNLIKYQGGSNPKDPAKRKLTFWLLFLINPGVSYAVGLLTSPGSGIAKTKHMDSLPIGIVIGVVVYLVLGIALSKLMKTSKIGNWF